MLEQVIRRPYQQYLVDNIAKKLSPYISPIQITFAAGVLGIATFVALCLGQNILGCVCLLLSGYCDTLDGTLARLSERSSQLGSVFDIFMDRLVEFCVIIGLWSIAPLPRSLACLLMLGSIFLCVTSFLVVGIFTENQSDKGFHYSTGIIERAEAFIFFIAMILFPSEFAILAYTFTLLVMLTTFIRLYEFYNANKNL